MRVVQHEALDSSLHLRGLEIVIRVWLGQGNTVVHDESRYHSTVKQVDTVGLVTRAMKSNWINVSWRSMGCGIVVGECGSERLLRGEIKA